MKNNLITYRARLCLLLITITLLGTAGMNLLCAQYNAPVLADSFVGTGMNPNAAMMDYTPNTTIAWGGPYQLKAVVADDPGILSGPVYLYLSDGSFAGFQTQILTPAYAWVYPDVQIANNLNNPSDYYIAVVENVGGTWVAGPKLVGGTIMLDVWEVSNVGNGGPLTVTFVGYYPVSKAGVAIDMPHIDVEAQYSTLLAGYPTCDKIAITWEEDASPSTIIQGYTASLQNIVNNYGSISPSPLFGSTIGNSQTIFLGYITTVSTVPTLYATGTLGSTTITNTVITEGFWPDVAMVERYDPTIPAYVDWAFFTYETNIPYPGNNSLDYAEWNTSTNAATISVLEQGDIVLPRIDAIDNYNYNAPGGGGAYFDIAVEGRPVTPTLKPYSIWQYNNVTGGGGIDMIGSLLPYTLPYQYNYFNATVAAGPSPNSGDITHGNYDYSVNFFTNYYTYSYPAYHTYISLPIDWATGMQPTTNYWGVPYNAISCSTRPNSKNALASTCNVDGSLGGYQYLYGCWDDGTSNIYGKFSSLVPFGWKHSSIKNNAIKKEWTVWPNPAANNINITASSGTEKGSYCISDITGREILSGNMNSETERVDISKLASGIYIMHLYEKGNEVKVVKVVKE